MLKKFKYFLEDDSLFTFLVVFLMLLIAFGAGRATTLEISHESFLDNSSNESVNVGLLLLKKRVVVNDSPFVLSVNDIDENTVVASQNGTRYYYLHCSGLSRINEDNMVYFKSSHYARFSGYARAVNCS